MVTKNLYRALGLGVTALMVASTSLMSLGCNLTTTEYLTIEDGKSIRHCLLGEDDEPTIRSGESLTLEAWLVCPPSGIQPVDAWCDAELDGDLLEVTSEHTFKREVPLFGGRVDRQICAHPVIAHCEVPRLDDGDYELRNGDSVEVFSVPSEDNMNCERRRFSDRGDT